jgi:hypothetical protein
VVWELALDKALDPDGFTIHFYRRCWSIIKYDLIRIIKYAHKSFRIGEASNSSFLDIIPKEENPSSFSQFHPISYKIMTKIITNVLKLLLPKIIIENQVGFKK